MRLLLLGLAACGFTGKDLPGDGAAIDAPSIADAPADTTMMIDGAGPTMTCVEKWHAGGDALQLSSPVPLTAANTTMTERDPFVTRDGKTLYFNRNGVIYQAAITGGLIQVPVALTFKDNNDQPIGVSKTSMLDDNKTAVAATSNPLDNNHLDVAFWGRQADGLTFKRLGPIAAASNGNVDDFDPEITGDGLALYWAPNALGGVPYQQIHVVTRPQTTATFPATSTALTELGAANRADPTVDGLQQILLFSTFDNGGEIDYAVRDTTDATWTPKGAVPAINTAAGAEGDAHLSDDACTVYFGRYVSNVTDWDLFVSYVL